MTKDELLEIVRKWLDEAANPSGGLTKLTIERVAFVKAREGDRIAATQFAIRSESMVVAKAVTVVEDNIIKPENGIISPNGR